jgi:hypothetical protein
MKNERKSKMNFDYYTLKKLAKEGSRIGNWNGKAVFAASASNLENLGGGAFYVLYDDDNKIVGRDGKHFYSYGTVSESGSVSEYNSRRRYNAVCETQHGHGDEYQMNMAMKYSSEPVPAATATVSYAPGYDVSERPVGDVKAEIDVEKVLKSAREMSVESLLDGFLANVSF